MNDIQIFIGNQVPVASFVGLSRLMDFRDQLSKLFGEFNHKNITRLNPNEVIISTRLGKVFANYPKDGNLARSISRAKRLKVNGLLIFTLISHVKKRSEKLYEALIWVPGNMLKEKDKHEIVREIFKKFDKIERERGGEIYIISYDDFRILSLGYAEYLISKTVMNMSKSLSLMSKSIKIYVDRMKMLEKIVEQLAKIIKLAESVEEKEEIKDIEEEPPSELYT